MHSLSSPAAAPPRRTIPPKPTGQHDLSVSHCPQAAGGSLKLKEVQSAVATAALEKLGGKAAAGVGKKKLRAEVAARVAGSSKFVVEGKLVRLRGSSA